MKVRYGVVAASLVGALGVARERDLAASAPMPIWGSSALQSTAEPAKPPRELTASLAIHLTGLRSNQGRVAVALFHSAAAFPDQKQALRGSVARIEGTKAYVRFEGLQPGTYAVAVLHDENANDKMDFNFVGMPLEGFGFSNDASVWLGPPSYDAAAFRLVGARSQIRIKVRYFEL
jgi:uncharacterized protein (DUF2141 family)